MQIVFDFIAGDIPFDEFWDAYCVDPKIGEWLDSIADFSHEPPPVIANVSDGAISSAISWGVGKVTDLVY